MDLEQRVQILEQELEILKNQIQATLLDIQEQLLTNAYPSLRADDTPAPNDSGSYRGDNSPASNAPRKNIQIQQETRQENFPNARRITFDDSGAAYETTSPPQAKQVLPPTPRPTPPEPAARPTTKKTNWSTLSELEAWASDKVKEIGTKRTRKLVEMHYRKGMFDDDAKEMLLGLISLYEEEKPASNTKRISAEQSLPPSPQPAPKTARKQAPVQSRPAAKRQAAPPPKPSIDPRPTQPALPPSSEDEDAEGEEHNLVLKLIAGVQNAGAGMTRRKKHG